MKTGEEIFELIKSKLTEDELVYFTLNGLEFKRREYDIKVLEVNYLNISLNRWCNNMYVKVGDKRYPHVKPKDYNIAIGLFLQAIRKTL